MALRCDDHAVEDERRLVGHPGRCGGERAQPEIELAGLEHGHRVLRGLVPHDDLDLGEPALEGPDRTGQEVQDGALSRSHSHRPHPGRARGLLDLRGKGLPLLEERNRALEQGSTLGGELVPSSHLREEADAQVLLQRLQGHAEARLAPSQHAGGPGGAPLPSHLDEGADQSQLHRFI